MITGTIKNQVHLQALDQKWQQKKQELFSKIRSLSQQAMALGATREELLAQIPTKEEEA